jgi:hypothetical protein
LIIFLIGITLRITPEIVAYPNPIGYDVVNYYIPMITNFDQHWPTISGQFPLYVSLLHIVKEATGLSAQSTVVMMAVIMFGIFSIAIYLTSRIVLKVGVLGSIFITIFVIFQLSVLRNAWDLHRDILALSASLLTFSLIIGSANSNNNYKTFRSWKRRLYHILPKKHDYTKYSDEDQHQNTKYGSADRHSEFYIVLTIASIIAACTIAAGTSRLVGSLFCASIIINAIINRHSKHAILYAVFTAILFSALLVTSEGTHYTLNHQADQIANPPQDPDGVYSPRNLRVLFAVMDGIIIIPGIYGITKLVWIRKKIQKNHQRPNLNLLAVPLLISLAGSFSWIAFPYHDLLVADRWIYLFGIFLSIFAGYGIVVGLIQEHLMKQKVHQNNNDEGNNKNNIYNIDRRKIIVSLLVSGSILGMVIVIGVAYAVMPYKDPFILFKEFRSHTEYFAPVTMQFNSLDAKDTTKLIDTIMWINKNTEPNSIIAGEKHWRGFMELYLQGGRTYLSLNSPDVKAYELNPKDDTHILGYQKHIYLIYQDHSLFNPFIIEKIET